jgi:hypothetical protein
MMINQIIVIPIYYRVLLHKNLPQRLIKKNKQRINLYSFLYQIREHNKRNF